MITLTEVAASKVEEFIKNQPEGVDSLHVGVRGGGCSGFSYYLEFAKKEEHPNAKIIETQGVTLVVDSKSYLYLMGSEIDYLDGLSGTGFKFTNPTAKRTCGCGESFSV